ncbi:MAG: type II secretion system protein [Armatimonadota bacterium]
MSAARRPLICATGFTLIELLVVIAVIGVLSALLFPVLARARQTAKSSVCQSNLRQIGAAFTTYLADYDDTYPANEADPFLWMGRRWRWPLQRYLVMPGRRADPNDPLVAEGYTPGILLCPSDETAREKWDSTSYAYSAAFYHDPRDVNGMTDTKHLWDPNAASKFPVVPQTLSDVRFPAQKALCGEWLANHTGPTDASWWDSERRGSHNYVFADGHAKTVSARAIRPTANGLPAINVPLDGVAGRDVE